MRITEILSENTLPAQDWIDRVYAQYPQTWQNNHVMPLGDEQFAMFELEPSRSRRGAVDIKWFQAYPLRSGVGTRAMHQLQQLAQADGIHLTLFPWQHGQVSQAKLMKFYRGQGFKPTVKGAKNMHWEPEITEAPLADYQPIGDFNRPGPFRGADRRLVPHPINQLKTAQFFEKTPYDFRLFFSNIQGTGKYAETGPVTAEQLQGMFGDQIATQIITDSQDAITVVFVGNTGADKVMITPWIMAHRIGHAIQAGNRRGQGSSHVWKTAEDHFFRNINQMLVDFYGRASHGSPDQAVNWSREKQYAALFNAIGTQRSSRQGQITRPYEFLYELFAQYLGTGKITLNPLPQQKDYGRKAWGHSTQSLKLTPGAGEEAGYTTEVLARDMELMFDDVLSSLVGTVLVM